MILYYSLFAISVLFYLYPQDFLYAFDRAWVWLSVRILNYYLMFEAWKLYRTISLDRAKMGLPVTAFSFTPIWER